MTRYLLTLLIIVFCIKFSKGQINPDVSDYDFDLNAGTFFTSGSGMSTNASYLMPSVDYKLSSKITILTGGVFMKSSFLNNNLNVGNVVGSDFNTSASNNLLFVGGRYNFSKKFSVTGIGYGTFGDNNSLGYQFTNDEPLRGVMLNFDYKVSDKMFFHGRINISNNMRYSSPYYNYYHNRSFYYGNSFFDNASPFMW